MDPVILSFLASPEGRARIVSVAGALAAGASELALVSQLRAAYDSAVAAEILAQARLQKKATAKLGPRSAGLILLPDSLEQASRAEVADSRARRLLLAGVTSLTDAGAGMGADTLAYAAAGLHVRAVERDPLVASVLRANVASAAAVTDDPTSAGLAGSTGSAGTVEVLEGDTMDLLPDSGVVYFDPARRADGRRIFDPELCSPPLSAIVAASERGLTVVAKMSPSLKLGDVPAGWDADWVSTQTEQGRSVVEAVLWSPPVGAGVRRAIVLDHDSSHILTSTDAPGVARTEAGPGVGDIGRFIYEPDGAVNQAELTDALAAQLCARLVEPRIAYLTGDAAVDTPFAHRYEVHDVLPWSKRGLARALSKYDASDLVIKKRGITVDPTALRKELLPRLRSRTGAPLVVILTPHRGKRLALFTHANESPQRDPAQ